MKMHKEESKEQNIDLQNPATCCSIDPKLVEIVIASKKMLKDGKTLPKSTTDELLDLESLNLILNRPIKTRAHTLMAANRELASVVGERKALVLLIDFSDEVATENKQHYEDMLFSSGTYASGSLRDYYYEASYNKLKVIGDVSGEGGVTVGWYRAPKPYSYYTNNDNGFGDYPQNAQKLVEDVVDLAAPHVNFADYDNDGDGIVDALFVVHAGPGAESTGSKSDIWSHAWSITPRTVDGVKVISYSMEPENGNIGVFCHELGHVFGLPDLYDYGYDSAGTGNWDLMAGGSWNNGGLTPAHPVGWCKVKLGWVTPVTIFGAQQNITLKPCETNEQMYKLPINDVNSKEYFLLENRKKTHFDSHLPGEGLIISHIDDNKSNNNDQTHYLVDIEQCDGKLDLNKYINRGDAGDPYPSTANTVFTSSTTPNSRDYSDKDSKVTVENIKRSGDDITATVKVNINIVLTKEWYYNKNVASTFAHCTTQWAWASIDTLGWRRIKDGSSDGVTNMFDACCEAVANNRKVHVYADGDFIYTMYLL